MRRSPLSDRRPAAPGRGASSNNLESEPLRRAYLRIRAPRRRKSGPIGVALGKGGEGRRDQGEGRAGLPLDAARAMPPRRDAAASTIAGSALAASARRAASTPRGSGGNSPRGFRHAAARRGSAARARRGRSAAIAAPAPEAGRAGWRRRGRRPRSRPQSSNRPSPSRRATARSGASTPSAAPAAASAAQRDWEPRP